jgi:hypothetical protein
MVKEYLGSWYDAFPEPGLMKDDPDAFVNVELGINDIVSIREILEHNKSFEVADQVKIALRDFNFYKVSLASSFSHGNKLRFFSATIDVLNF